MQYFLTLVGQGLVGLFFIVTGLSNIKSFNKHVSSLEKTIIPYPLPAMVTALIFQIAGGLSILFNFYPKIGAIACLIFTALATALFVRFWEIKNNPQKFGMMFSFFFEHLAVMGALLMILVR